MKLIRSIIAITSSFLIASSALIICSASTYNMALQTIQIYATNCNASSLTTDLLATAGVKNAFAGNLGVHYADFCQSTGYIGAIEASTAGQVDTVEKLQSLVDKINFENCPKISGVSVGRIYDGNLEGSKDPNNPAVLKIQIPRDITSYNIHYFNISGGGYFYIHPWDFTSSGSHYAVIVDDIPISGTETVFYAKTTYSGSQSRFYKIILTQTDGVIDDPHPIEDVIEAATIYHTLTIQQLIKAGISSNDLYENNLDEYTTAISSASNAHMLATTNDLQMLITTVNNASDVGTATKQLSNYESGDAVIMDTLKLAGLKGLFVNNLDMYKQSIGLAAKEDSDTRSELQKLVDTVNAAQWAAAVAVIRDYAANDDATNLDIDKLVAAGVTGATLKDLGQHDADTSKSTGYIGAIERSTPSNCDTTAKIQAIIDSVNNSLSVATITGVSTGTVSGDLRGSSDLAYPSEFNVSISTTVTAYKPSYFTTNGTVYMYTNSDYATGLVGTDGVAITDNTTVLYVKVVNISGSSTKYYKVNLNVVEPQTKYKINGSAKFTKAGSNYKVTVSVDRVKAAPLANPKLYVVYTWSNGGQSYQTLEVIGKTKDVIAGNGIKSVQVFLVDGDVDWSVGMPTFKANFIEVTQ